MNLPNLSSIEFKDPFGRIPVDAMVKATEGLNEMYMQGMQMTDQLQDQMLAINVSEDERSEKEQIVGQAMSQIEEFSKNGNFEDAPIQAMKIARGLKNNEFLRNAAEKYAYQQKELELAQEYDISDAQQYGMMQHRKAQGKIQKDKYGRYTRYSPFDVFKEPDIRGEVTKAMDSMKAQKTSEFVEDGKKMYVINHEILSEADLYNRAVGTIASDPKASKLLDWETRMHIDSLPEEAREALLTQTFSGKASDIARRRDMLSVMSAVKGGARDMKPDTAKRREQYVPALMKASQTHDVDMDILDFIANQESRYNPSAVSKAGAKGLMQFMDGTAKDYGVNQFDPDSSIDGAARYIKDLLKMYNGDREKALAAYNYGQGNINEVLKKAYRTGQDWRELVPDETKNYVKGWNSWSRPEFNFDGEMSKLDEEEKLLSAYQERLNTPEGKQALLYDLMKDNILRSRYGPLAGGRAVDNETISNLRRLDTGSNKSSSTGSDYTSMWGYSHLGANPTIPEKSPYAEEGKASKKFRQFDEGFNRSRQGSEGTKAFWKEIALGPVGGLINLYNWVDKHTRDVMEEDLQKKTEASIALKEFEQGVETFMSTDVTEDVVNTVKSHGYEPIDMGKVKMKDVVEQSFENARNVPILFKNLGEKGNKILGMQEDPESGTPIEGNSTFALLTDGESGGGSYAEAGNLSGIQEQIRKSLGKNKNAKLDFKYIKMGVSPSNPVGMNGGILYTVKVINRETGEHIRDFDVIKSNSNPEVARLFQPLGEVAKFVYSKVPGNQELDIGTESNPVVMNIPVKSNRGYEVVSYVKDDDVIMSWDQFAIKYSSYILGN